jgi:hypothetical protein
MKEGFFYYIKAGFGLWAIGLQVFWSVCCGVFFGVLAGVSFLFALIVATLKLLGAAAYGMLIEDWRDRKGSVPRMDCPPGPPQKQTADEINTARLRQEQRLIQQFKIKKNERINP